MNRRRGCLFSGVFPLPLLAAAALASGCGRDGDGGTGAGTLPVLGAVTDFALTERSGRTVTRADLLGRTWIADFIFTRCAGPCPRLTARMARLQRELPPSDSLRLVSFTVDPAFDTPAVLSDYADRFRADPRRWLFLTGSQEAVHGLVSGGFRLSIADAPPGGTDVTHSSRFALVDRAGRIRGYYEGEDDAAVEKLKRDVPELLK